MWKLRISLLAAALAAILPAVVLAQGTVPVGTEVIVSLDQSVSSKNAQVGDKLAGSVARNVVVNGRTVVPKGSKATVSVAAVQASGRLQTPAKLSLRVTSVVVNGRTYAVSSNLWSQTGPNHNKRNVVAIGGGTAAGALIGAIAGGGKGAAIGAVVGAGAGTVGAAATGKKDIEFPAESQLRFTTRTAVTIR